MAWDDIVVSGSVISSANWNNMALDQKTRGVKVAPVVNSASGLAISGTNDVSIGSAVVANNNQMVMLIFSCVVTAGTTGTTQLQFLRSAGPVSITAPTLSGFNPFNDKGACIVGIDNPGAGTTGYLVRLSSTSTGTINWYSTILVF